MLGPRICFDCKRVYTLEKYTEEQGDECVKWSCPKCKKEGSTDYALTISKELFDELFSEESKMNQKQQQIIDLYRESFKKFQSLLEMKNYDYYDQDSFLTNVSRLRTSLAKFHEISVRGSEQWEYWFGLSEEEFKEVIDHLKESK